MATTTRRAASAALAAMGAAAYAPLFTRVAFAGNARPTAGASASSCHLPPAARRMASAASSPRS